MISATQGIGWGKIGLSKTILLRARQGILKEIAPGF
jgi:hypothetical protein